MTSATARAHQFSILNWAIEILWALLLIGLPLTSFPLLGNITRSVVVPFSAMPLAIILIVWFLPYLLRHGSLPLESRPLFAFIAVTIIASAAAYFMAPMIFKNRTIVYQEVRDFLTLGIGLSFYLCIAAWASDKTHMQKALQWITIGGILMILWACVQAYYIEFHGVNYPHWFAHLRDLLVVQNSAVREGNRVTGLAYEPSWFAHLLNILFFPLWISASFQRLSAFRFRLFKVLTVEDFLLIPSLVVFVLSSPRVGMVAFLLMVVYLLIKINLAIYRWIIRRITSTIHATTGIGLSLVKVVIRVGLVLVFLAVYLGGIFGFVVAYSHYDRRYGYLLKPFTQAELNSLGLNENSFLYLSTKYGFEERLVYWFSGWHTFNDHPWLGVGIGNAGFYFPNDFPYQGLGTFEIRDVLYRLYDLPNIKSMWIRLLAETGLVGFACFATWYVLTWVSAWFSGKSHDPTIRLVALAGLLGILAFLVEGFSIDSFALPFLWVIMALAAANGVLYRKELSGKS